MTSRRVLKVASAIREVVSMSILTQIRDPRVKDVTVTYVEVAGDLRQAKVHVSIMGDEKTQDLCMHGLRSSTGFLQQKVSERVDTRYTPRLKFVLDPGVKKSAEVNRLLGELLPNEEEDEEEETNTHSQQPVDQSIDPTKQIAPLASHQEDTDRPTEATQD